MATEVAVQMTPQGLLIPRTALQDWGEVEVVQEKERIVIQPKHASRTERERVLQILEAAGLLLPAEPLPASRPPVSPDEQAELARKFSEGQPLSEIVIEERKDRA